MSPVIETERLILRELREEDKSELAAILCDPESMRFYPAPFDEERVEKWIRWNRESYRIHGHGLWAVILKEGGLFLGDCGVTMQEIDGKILPELGYHIKKEHWRKGYASEAAAGCLRYIFAHFAYDGLYSYASRDNLPSLGVARKNGMKYLKTFEKEVMGETVQEVLYGLSRPAAAGSPRPSL